MPTPIDTTLSPSQAEGPTISIPKASLDEAERLELLEQLVELKRAACPGRTAAKLRKRLGLSLEETASLAGLDVDDLKRFEKYGEQRILTTCFTDFVDEEHEHWVAQSLERLIAVLEPTEEEEAFLRRDLEQERAWLTQLIKRLLPDELWAELEEHPAPPPEDPWLASPSAPVRARHRGDGAALSTLSVIGESPDEGTDRLGPQEDRPQVHFHLRLVTTTADGQQAEHDVLSSSKGFASIEELGLTLGESKQMLGALQKHLVAHQIEAHLRERSVCGCCGQSYAVKGYDKVTLRTADRSSCWEACPQGSAYLDDGGVPMPKEHVALYELTMLASWVDAHGEQHDVDRLRATLHRAWGRWSWGLRGNVGCCPKNLLVYVT